MSRLRTRNFGEYAQLFARRKALIFFISITMLTSTLFVIRGLPNLYESEALVIVSGHQDDRYAAGARIAAVVQQLTSRSTLKSLIRNLSLYDPLNDLDGSVDQMRKAIKLDTKLRTDSPGFPESFTIGYRYTDRTITQRVVAELVSTFEATNREIERQISESASAVSSEMEDIEARLNQMSRERLSAMTGGDTADIAASVSTARTRQLALLSSIDDLNDKLFSLQRQIEAQKQQIEEQQQLLRSAPVAAGVRSGSSYGILLVRKAELEAQIKEYASQYTDKNPKLAQARGQLAEIKQQIDQLEAGGGSADAASVSSPEAVELRNLRRGLAQMQIQLQVTERDLERKKAAVAVLANSEGGKALAASSGDALLAREQAGAEYKRLQDRYSSLVGKLDSLNKQRLSAPNDGSLFRVVDPPSLPQLPAAPNKLMLELLALAASLGLGLLAAAALEFPRLFFIHDHRDVDFYLGVPVLGLIPETLTPVEHGRRRRLRLAGAVLKWLAVVILVPAIVFLLEKLQLFQLIAYR